MALVLFKGSLNNMVPDKTVAPGTVKITIVDRDGSERDIQAHFNVIYVFLPRPRFLLSCTFSLLFRSCRGHVSFNPVHFFASFLFLPRFFASFLFCCGAFFFSAHFWAFFVFAAAMLILVYH